MYNYAQTVEMVQESVTALGREFVYEKQTGSAHCLYVHNNASEEDIEEFGTEDLEPGCIVGDLLIRQHVLTLGELYQIQEEETDGKGDVEDIMKYITGLTGADFTVKAKDFLWSLQRRQDQGQPWGPAFDGAKDMVEDSDRHYTEETEDRIRD